eukprot:2221910-Pyramimonas_sp.AAC.1
MKGYQQATGHYATGTSATQASNPDTGDRQPPASDSSRTARPTATPVTRTHNTRAAHTCGTRVDKKNAYYAHLGQHRKSGTCPTRWARGTICNNDSYQYHTYA